MWSKLTSLVAAVGYTPVFHDVMASATVAALGQPSGADGETSVRKDWDKDVWQFVHAEFEQLSSQGTISKAEGATGYIIQKGKFMDLLTDK